jgi:hypothetical protein
MIKKYELELDDRKKCGGTDFWKKRLGLVRQNAYLNGKDNTIIQENI